MHVNTEKNGDLKCVVTKAVRPYLSLNNVETKQIDLVEVEVIMVASRGCKVGEEASCIEEAQRMSVLYLNLLYKL